MLSKQKGLKIYSVYNEKLVFNTIDYTNDLQGSLAANVKFAQSQIIPATVKQGDKQPQLIANRKTLLLVKPLEEVEALQVSVTDKRGKQLGVCQLNRPEQLPPTDYHIDNLPDGFDFNPLPGSVAAINTVARVNQLNQPGGPLLLQELKSNAAVEIQTADGRWVRDIYFPDAPEMENKVIRVRSNAGYTSTLHFTGRSTVISRGNTYVFKYVNGQWVWEKDIVNQGIIYALNTWSLELPASWIQPGFALHFTSGERSGKLNNIQVSAPTELLIHTIDIGMLTPPRDRFDFANNPEAHREYFQTAPVSKMIVGQYQSLHLTEVMLPDGRLLTDFDPGQGGVHDGTMRQRIGKELISLGINHANYGINCSEGQGEWTPYLAAQLTAHNSRGRYANGVIVHGMSGGKGMVSLHNSLGNEFSHEVGHCYDLIHYPGGFDGSVHQSADSVNSTWGWDSDRNKFLPNFQATLTDRPSCYEGTCQASFHGRSFGFDPMAGGEPMALNNRFTLYTPYTATQIQQFMEKKIVFAADSITGFKKWDSLTQQMEPYYHRVDTATPVVASNRDLSESTLATLLAGHKMVTVTMADGNWAQSIPVPTASQANKSEIITINHAATFNSQLHINGETITVSRGFNKNYYSDGSVWKECIVVNSAVTRTRADTSDLSQYGLAELFTRFRLVDIVLQDSNPAQEIFAPPAEKNNQQCILSITNDSSSEIKIVINGLSLHIASGEKADYISNGDRWLNNVAIIDTSKELKPEKFGVAVTTLVGYYDPQGELPGYIYPALHGAYGYLYKDNSDEIESNDCQLAITSEEGTQYFKLENHRIRNNLMNKFHINIAESDRPRTASLICNGKTVFSCEIQPAEVELTYTVNGENTPHSDEAVAPTGLRVTEATTDSISLAWDTVLLPNQGYIIYRNGQQHRIVSSSTFTDTGLADNTQYTYAVSTLFSMGASPASQPVTATTLPLPEVAPAAPTNLRSTSVTENSISLAWDAAAAGSQPLESYSIFRNENGGVTSVVASMPASQLTWNDSGLKADTRYNYFAIAYDVNGKMSDRSNALAVTTLPLPEVAPAAPANLRSTSVTENSISLAWDAAVSTQPLRSYSIFRNENGGITSVIASVPASQLSWNDSGLKADTRYNYFAIAYDVNGKMSDRSNALAVTTLPMPEVAPAAPANLRSTSVTENSISLAWDAAAAGSQPVDHYGLFRSENGGIASALVNVPASQLTFTDGELKADTRYSYFVIAYDANGKMSDRSNTLAITTLPEAALTAPANLRSTSVTANSVSLAWDAAAAGSQPLRSYSIFRNENGGVTSVVASVPASQLTLNDSGLKADTRYNYFAIAYDVNGKMSDRSNALAVTTLPEAAPAAPANLRSTSVTENSVSLAWDAAAPGSQPVDQYRLFRSENGTIASALADVPASQLTFTDSGLKAGATYSYFAIACDSKGLMSGRSNTLAVTLNASPALRSWAFEETFQAGEKVSYQNRIWICLQTHTAWVMDWAPGGADSATLWQLA